MTLCARCFDCYRLGYAHALPEGEERGYARGFQDGAEIGYRDGLVQGRFDHRSGFARTTLARDLLAVLAAEDERWARLCDRASLIRARQVLPGVQIDLSEEERLRRLLAVILDLLQDRAHRENMRGRAS